MSYIGNVQKGQYHNPLNQISGHDHYHQGFSYDGLNRLTSADYGIDSLSASGYFDVAGITYDAAGNIQTLQRGDDSGSLLDDLSYHYAAGTNRLDSLYDAAGGQTTWDAGTVNSFGYDAGGNLTSQSGKIDDVAYDHRNLPVRFALASGDTVIAGYNADGQRILKELKDGAWTFYVKDGQQTLAVLVQDTLAHMNLVANTTFGRIEANNGAISLSNARRYYITDHLGSTRAVVDDNGTVLETFDYYPFGLLMPKRNTANANTIEKFTGKERDEEGGLNLDYFGARYYDPAVSRWLSVDPLADEYPSWSPYNYVENDPVNLIDRLGLCPEGYEEGDVWNDSVCGPEVEVTAEPYEGDVQELGGPWAAWLFAFTHHPETAFGGENPMNQYRYFRVNNSIYVENISPEVITGVAPTPASIGKVGKTVSLVKAVKSILKPGGKLVGKVLGRSSKIRTVTPSEAESIISELIAAGAKRWPRPRYKGTWYKLPGGQGGFGVRHEVSEASVRKGSQGAIDLNILDLKGEIKRIHF